LNRLATPWRALGRRLSGSVVAIAAVVTTGILLGQQYMNPNKRVIAVMVAAIMVGIAWRVDMLWGIGVVILTVPYPRGTVFGNSNVALILVLIVIWMLRVTQRQSLGPRRTPVDVPIVGLLIAYVISFYNVGPEPALGYALENMQILVACVLMFYLIVSNVRTDSHLRRLHYFQIVSLFSILLISIYELNHPGQDFIPGWISFRHTVGDDFNLSNVRVGGPFFDYELLAEFTAISLLLVAFMVTRATSTTQRVVFGGLMLLATFILFATVTRGALISLGAAVLYLLWIVRRRLAFIPLTIGVGALVALFFAMNLVVSNFTRSGDLLERLFGTTFVGMVPDSRQAAWKDGWERFLQQPIIGHGPYYTPMTGTRTWFWPHNGYLYIANLVGLVGLTFYLWFVGRLLWISRPIVDSLRHTSYASAFLIVGHVQLVLFLIDQIKIDFLRNEIYQFTVWIMFANITAAHLIARDQRARTNGAQPPTAPGLAARAGTRP
jgi:O-antigen ligase